jgi:hypothetical protein
VAAASVHWARQPRRAGSLRGAGLLLAQTELASVPSPSRPGTGDSAEFDLELAEKQASDDAEPERGEHRVHLPL